MSGHSKWSTIKRAKAKTDATRGKIFSKLAREVTVAAKTGGGDPASNARLRLVVDKAKAANMPKDNIERAIAKGAGGGEGSTIEEFTYEGYGPAGSAVIVDVMTDNKNRTLGEVQFIFSKHGGNMGKAGCVSWQFTRCGVITADKSKVNAENLMTDAIEAGAEDINDEDAAIEIKTKPENYEAVLNALRAKGYEFISSEITLVPNSTIKVAGDEARKLLKLVDALEEHDDVQNVYSNFEIEDGAIG
ncbi:MAG: YebC/PmpR family DNA-binding transcriptional regulator [Candidatus Saganbacteria bacterium]|nr:YebC/PmpR family DNA-binding transcriptional regulator [Candidatus Saganbacteria bacterium]